MSRGAGNGGAYARGSDGSASGVHVATVRRDDEAMIILRGELDIATAPMVAQELRCGEVAGARSVLVDLERVVFADLAGLDPLVAFALPARADRRVAFTAGTSAVRLLLALTGLDGRLNVLAPEALGAWA